MNVQNFQYISCERKKIRGDREREKKHVEKDRKSMHMHASEKRPENSNMLQYHVSSVKTKILWPIWSNIDKRDLR